MSSPFCNHTKNFESIKRYSNVFYCFECNTTFQCRHDADAVTDSRTGKNCFFCKAIIPTFLSREISGRTDNTQKEKTPMYTADGRVIYQ